MGFFYWILRGCSSIHCFQVELEFGNVGFCGAGEENRSTRGKTLGAGTRTNNKLNPHMTPRPGIEPGQHWWEASALTTAPSLLPAPCMLVVHVASFLSGFLFRKKAYFYHKNKTKITQSETVQVH